MRRGGGECDTAIKRAAEQDAVKSSSYVLLAERDRKQELG